MEGYLLRAIAAALLLTIEFVAAEKNECGDDGSRVIIKMT